MDRSRVRGMLLGGAIGDALGNPIEFLSINGARKHFGPNGVTTLILNRDGFSEITDDTQMTLFTLEGMIRGHHQLRRTPRPGTDPLAVVVRTVHGAYLRWLRTQHDYAPDADMTGWLVGHQELHVPRAPGLTCLSALRRTNTPGCDIATPTNRINDSKGCGSVMRAGAVALWPGSAADVFRLGIDTGALTHSHPTGFLAAGAFAVIVRELLNGNELLTAIEAARESLRTWPNQAEVTELYEHIDLAVRLGSGQRNWTGRRQEPVRLTPEAIASELGGGWTAEDALAIALYSALVATDFEDGVCLAVNHSGDSDSTGAVAGNILGAMYGEQAIPTRWLNELELADVIGQIGDDALTEFGTTSRQSSQEWLRRFPPN
ncbi:MAG TPA: ADP-ribosylglycohydrolase family protein [Pseudonocardiaceae bacterium]